jgi:hypothetical protein
MPKKNSMWDKIISVTLVAVGATMLSEQIIIYLSRYIANTPIVVAIVAFVMIVVGWKLMEVL